MLHYLVDLALPNNRIPRVYSNTGIEYWKVVEFVKELQKTDDRIVILTPKRNIRQTLDEYGYPFKSKSHSYTVRLFQKYKDLNVEVFKKIEDDPKLLESINFLENLGTGTKGIVSYKYGVSSRDGQLRTRCSENKCPKILQYQFSESNDLNISDLCCFYMKEKPLNDWSKENNKPHTMVGIMQEEGGRRQNAVCQFYRNNKLSFHPLAKVTKDWEDWFIEKYNIKLCDLYYPPFNFKRTGCKGCPFARNLQKDLDTLQQYFPAERKQCEILWKPVYDEYRRIGYRLKPIVQEKLDI